LNKAFMAQNEDKALFTIGQAAKRAGVSTQSLQYYLMVGLLEPTEVTPSGRRLFDQEAVEFIRLIRTMNRSGYTLQALRDLVAERRLGRGRRTDSERSEP
jgi:DNA-binding transcriptional MerR regulator